MMAGWKTKCLLSLAVVALVMFAFSTPTVAQCSMCRAALGGSNNPFFIRNFNIGVLVLLIPPVTIFCSIFVALKRHKAADDKETEGAGSRPEAN